MDKWIDIVSKRKAPGVIILDESGNLQYMNDAVRDIVPVILARESSERATVPENIRKAALQIKSSGFAAAPASIFYAASGQPYYLRVFPLGSGSERTDPSLMMVLIEMIAERQQIDFEEVRSRYGLSKRELEVLKLVCQGYSNREIAEKLFISEYTAKDHVRKILQAFDASSRVEVIAVLNN